MLGWLKNVFGSSDSTPKTPSKQSNHEAVDLTTLSAEERKKSAEEVAVRSGLKVYNTKKRIDYVYTEGYVGRVTPCPRCDSPTETQYADFMYATKSLPKSMYAAAGHFCTSCHTVILEESVIENALPDDASFQGIIGINTAEEPITFRAFNDKETFYVKDLQKGIIRMKLLDGTSKTETERDRRKKLNEGIQKQIKRNKRIANQTKKINRKK